MFKTNIIIDIKQCQLIINYNNCNNKDLNYKFKKK